MSTTAEDAEIRKRLYSRVGPRTARARLAERFPSGSAKGEIERRVAVMAESEDSLNEEAANSILDVIVEELVKMRSSEELSAEKDQLAEQSRKASAKAARKAAGSNNGKPGGKPGGPPKKRRKKQISA
jgi:hypothetical protein